jgi:twitching motility protein PilT
MADLISYLTRAVESGASDLFLVPGAAVSMKLDGQILTLDEAKLSFEDSEELLGEIFRMAERDMENFRLTGDDDFSFSVPGLARFRVSAYKQRGSMAAVIRVVSFTVPDWQEFGIPSQVMELSRLKSGMVLITGTAGCGKTTTLSCIIDKINRERSCHIITLEDPIEYLHRNHKSIVSQREIGVDTSDYLSALRSCLRQAPDVIQLGEMRDLETIRTAMTAAETGHLLLATLHTKGAVNTIDRIIDTFPSDQQNQIRTQLSAVLKTVVSQQLVPDVNGGLVPAFEILQLTGAVRSMIRDCKNHQIDAAIAAGANDGMISMDQSLLKLYRDGKITAKTALGYADNPEQLQRRMGQ